MVLVVVANAPGLLHTRLVLDGVFEPGDESQCQKVDQRQDDGNFITVECNGDADGAGIPQAGCGCGTGDAVLSLEDRATAEVDSGKVMSQSCPCRDTRGLIRIIIVAGGAV